MNGLRKVKDVIVRGDKQEACRNKPGPPVGSEAAFASGWAAAMAANAPMSDVNVAALIDEVDVGDSTLATAALRTLPAVGQKFRQVDEG